MFGTAKGKSPPVLLYTKHIIVLSPTRIIWFCVVGGCCSNPFLGGSMGEGVQGDFCWGREWGFGAIFLVLVFVAVVVPFPF